MSTALNQSDYLIGIRNFGRDNFVVTIPAGIVSLVPRMMRSVSVAGMAQFQKEMELNCPQYQKIK